MIGVLLATSNRGGAIVSRSFAQVLGGAFLSALLVAACNHAPASNVAAESNVYQNSHETANANGSKKGLLSGLFESRKEVTIPEGV